MQLLRKVLILSLIFLFVWALLFFDPFSSAGGGLEVDDWPMFRHDSEHTGFSTSSAPNMNHTLWKYETGGQVWSSPAVIDGVVYVGSFDGSFYALNSSTGSMLWSFPTGGEVYSSPAISNGIVYFGSFDNCVYGLNASNGFQLWKFKTGGKVFSSPTIATGVVYFGSDDGFVYALEAQTGDLLWSYETGDTVQSSSSCGWCGLCWF